MKQAEVSLKDRVEVLRAFSQQLSLVSFATFTALLAIFKAGFTPEESSLVRGGLIALVISVFSALGTAYWAIEALTADPDKNLKASRRCYIAAITFYGAGLLTFTYPNL